MSWYAHCDYQGCCAEILRPEGRRMQQEAISTGPIWRRLRQASYDDPLESKGLWQELHLCPEHAKLLKDIEP